MATDVDTFTKGFIFSGLYLDSPDWRTQPAFPLTARTSWCNSAIGKTLIGGEKKIKMTDGAFWFAGNLFKKRDDDQIFQSDLVWTHNCGSSSRDLVWTHLGDL